MSRKNQVTQFTLKDLHTIVKKAARTDIPTVTALAAKLFTRKSEAAAFMQLLAWMPHSKRADGAVYKSAVQLAAETGYTPRTMERALDSLREIAFDTFVRKAAGAPTTHFLLNAGRLLRGIAKLLSVTVEEIISWIQANIPKPKNNHGYSHKQDNREESLSTNANIDIDIDIDEEEFLKHFRR